MSNLGTSYSSDIYAACAMGGTLGVAQSLNNFKVPLISKVKETKEDIFGQSVPFNDSMSLGGTKSLDF